MSLHEVVLGLRSGPTGGALLALHQLQELILRASGDGSLAGVVPPLGELLASPDADASDPELPLLAVRSLVQIADVEPSALRAVAKPAVLSALATTLGQLRDLDTGIEVVRLAAVVAGRYPSAVLRAGLLGAVLGVADHLPRPSQRAAYVLAVHAAECVAGRGEAALVLDATPQLVGAIAVAADAGEAALAAAEAARRRPPQAPASTATNSSAAAAAAVVVAPPFDPARWDVAQLAARALGRFLSHATALANGVLVEARREAGGRRDASGGRQSPSSAAGSSGGGAAASELASAASPSGSPSAGGHSGSAGGNSGSGGGGGGSPHGGRTSLPAFASTAAAAPVPAASLVVWPVQAVQHLVALGAVDALCRLLALHARATVVSGLSTAPQPVAPGSGSQQAAATAHLPLLRHSAFRAIVRALVRLLVIVPPQRAALERKHGLVAACRRLLRSHATAAGAPPLVAAAPLPPADDDGDAAGSGEARAQNDVADSSDEDAAGSDGLWWPPAPAAADDGGLAVTGATTEPPIVTGAGVRHLAERMEDTLLLLQLLLVDDAAPRVEEARR